MDRFWSKVNKDGPVPESRPELGPCWEWTASRTRGGYGQFRLAGKTLLAHKLAYELEIGPVPEGLELDHLCRNEACVNLDHLEAVTHQENMARGAHGLKTHCPQGHPYSGGNLRIRADGTGRVCCTCATAHARKARQRIQSGSR